MEGVINTNYLSLDDKYRIETDDNNVVLQFFENRIRKNKKTKLEEEYEYVESFYYPSIKTALKAYLNKALKECKTTTHILSELKRVECIIDKIKL